MLVVHALFKIYLKSNGFANNFFNSISYLNIQILENLKVPLKTPNANIFLDKNNPLVDKFK